MSHDFLPFDDYAESVPGSMHITSKNQCERYWHDKLPTVWAELVSTVQDVFNGKAIPEEFSYEILCLIPKETQGKYCGIALLEVVYKLVSMIIHLRLQAAIEFHPSLHGFR
jgi:hypothetical protein